MDTWAISLLFLSDQSSSAVGRAGSALPPCLSVQINVVHMLWFSWYLYCCSYYKSKWCVCTVGDIKMGEHRHTIVHGLWPWHWLVHLIVSLTLVPENILMTLQSAIASTGTVIAGTLVCIVVRLLISLPPVPWSCVVYFCICEYFEKWQNWEIFLDWIYPFHVISSNFGSAGRKVNL